MPGPNDHHVVKDESPSGHHLESGLGADEPPDELRRGASRASVVALKQLREDAANDIKAAAEQRKQADAAKDAAATERKRLEKERADFEMEKAAFLAEKSSKQKEK